MVGYGIGNMPEIYIFTYIKPVGRDRCYTGSMDFNRLLIV